MMSKDTQEHQFPPEVRAAIHEFLDDTHGADGPFALSEAIEAVRRVFPDLDMPDDDLADAITSEASVVGFDIEYDEEAAPTAIKRKEIDRWDNEGGASGKTGRD